MNRKNFITSLGATCKNWTWSWSFINEAERFIVFGEWDVYAQENESLIFSKEWRLSAKGHRTSGYSQSLDHLNLIENHGYRLFTFPMELDQAGREEHDPASIKSIVPQLEEKKLLQRDNQWFAIPLDTQTQDRLSRFHFQHYFQRFLADVRQHDGREFQSFKNPGIAFEWEGYKETLYAIAQKRLKIATWTDDLPGSGEILRSVVDAIEIKSTAEHSGNNLLKWSQYGTHNILIEAQQDPKLCFTIESLLFDFYTGELNGEDVFDPLVEAIGAKYPLIAYLFFISDCDRYLPIAPEHFDSAFHALNIDLQTSRQCSWENYSRYLKTIQEIQTLIRAEGYQNTSLLDAHSFTYMFDHPKFRTDEDSLDLPQITESKGQTFGATQPQKPWNDWEALAKARKELGDLGEQIALEFEKQRHLANGQEQFIEETTLVSEDHTLGYDIISREPDGSPRLIEVKTISDHCMPKTFYTSSRQLEVASESNSHFYYIVEHARSENPTVRTLKATDIPSDRREPIVYKITL
ncbi:MAG: DUF3883 domain-containing protein [Verrucomicrobiaceae bacterium]